MRSEPTHVVDVILELALDKNCRAISVTADGEVLRPPVLLWHRSSYTYAVFLCSLGKTVGKMLGLLGSIERHAYAPSVVWVASWDMPLAVAWRACVEVYGYDTDVGGAVDACDVVGTCNTSSEGCVCLFRSEQTSIITLKLESFYYLCSHKTSIIVFAESLVAIGALEYSNGAYWLRHVLYWRRAFASCVRAVTVVY